MGSRLVRVVLRYRFYAIELLDWASNESNRVRRFIIDRDIAETSQVHSTLYFFCTSGGRFKKWSSGQ